jgi:hypothetical protein
MQKAKSLPIRLVEQAPVSARLLQQVRGAFDVRVQERLRVQNRAVDMGFRREVDDGPGAMSAISPTTSLWRGSPAIGSRLRTLPA